MKKKNEIKASSYNNGNIHFSDFYQKTAIANAATATETTTLVLL